MKNLKTKLFAELYRFIIFYICLTFTAALFTSLRTIDKKYQLADISTKESDLQAASEKNQFLSIYSDTFFLNFGKTSSGEDTAKHILSRLEPTMILAFFATLLGGGFAIWVALLSAFWKKTWFTKFFIYLSSIILSTPIFVVAVFLFLLFFLFIPILPPGGYERGNLFYLILPGFSLGSRVFARIFFYAQSEIQLEIGSPFVLSLLARGFPRSKIIFRYVFFKVFPLLSIFILLDLSSLLSGAMIVEEIFFYPGIGKSMFTAIKLMDENLLRALLIYSGTIFYILTRFSRVLQSELTGTES